MEDERCHVKKKKRKKRIWVKPIKKILTKLKLIAVLEKTTFVLKCLNFLKFCFIFKLTETNDSYYKELPA